MGIRWSRTSHREPTWRACTKLSVADDGVVIETAPVPPVDWSEAWKERIVAHELGPLTVAPPWLAEA